MLSVEMVVVVVFVVVVMFSGCGGVCGGVYSNSFVECLW